MGSVTSEQYRHAMSHLGGGVCLVTCRAGGVDHGMTATAVVAVSLDPPLLLVSVDQHARFHAAVTGAETDGFAVTFLTDSQAHVARHFSHSGRDLATQFDGFSTKRLANECLVLVDGLAAVGAHIHSRLPGGDHTLVLGELGEFVEGSGSSGQGPLVHFRSRFHALTRPADG